MGNWLWKRTSSRGLYKHTEICTMDRQSHGVTHKIIKTVLKIKQGAESEYLCTFGEVNFIYTETKACVVEPTGKCHLDRT